MNMIQMKAFLWKKSISVIVSDRSKARFLRCSGQLEPYGSLPAVGVARHADGAEAAIAEVIGHGVIGGRAVVRQNRRAVGSRVSIHMHRRIGGIGIVIDIIAAGTGIAAERAGTER